MEAGLGATLTAGEGIKSKTMGDLHPLFLREAGQSPSSQIKTSDRISLALHSGYKLSHVQTCRPSIAIFRL